VSEVEGTGVLVGLAVRRSRLLVASWLATFVAVTVVAADATVGLYPSLADRVAASETFNRSQSLLALYGRIYDPSSVGALAMIKFGGLGAVFVAMLSVVVVVRHTRADEEAGRLELVTATAVGRLAPLAAALVVVLGVNAALAVLTATGLALAGLPLDGSIAFGLAWAGVGITFGAIAAVAAQLTTSARTATGLCGTTLGVVYAVRAVGDAADASGPRWLSWLSPIGWAQQFKPYAGNRWWVALLTLGFAVLVALGAFALAARRDLGTGLLPARPGPARASARLRSPLTLAWRLHRNAFAGWAAAFLLLGVLLGGLAASVGDFVNNPNARDLITKLGGTQGLTDAFLAAELGFAGIIASGYGIQAATRLRSEETASRAEPVLATSVGRVRWALSHLAVALAGTAGLLVLVGAGAGLTRAAQTGHPAEAGRVMAAALVQIPAVWVLIGIVVAAYGLAPRLVVLGWIALAGFVLLAELGPLVGLSHWAMDLSPFAHVPKLPGSAFAPPPEAVLTALAALLCAVGLVGFRHRDLA
jgi:ABC-2 type transport system permease protein